MERHDEDVLVRVHRSWDGWQQAEVKLGSLRNVHWFQPARAPHEMIHAVVSCADIISGEIPHECDGSSAPHDLHVCLVKRHFVPSAYAELVRRAITIAQSSRSRPNTGSPPRDA